MRDEKEIRDRLKGCQNTMYSQLGEHVCCLASVQAKVLEWVLSERDFIS